jgi:dTDP-4-amino-4,6-dideoxygalactose transaminase
VRVPERDAWRAALTEAGVQTGVHYPIPVHLQPAYADLGYSRGDFPIAEQAAAEVLSLPMFPEMTDQQIESIATVFRAGVLIGKSH